MTIWGSTTLRRLAMPLAVVSLGAALTAGWGQSLASSGSAASASDPNAIDPEVAVQSISFVLVPKGNDNFRPENACGGGPSLTTGTPPVANPHPYGTGLSLLQKLSIGPTRCTLAIFTPNSDQVEDLAYSSTPCPVTTTNPVTTPNQSLKFVGLKNPNNLKACTAPAFLSTQGGSSPTTPDLRNPDLTAAQGAAGKLAVQRWAGSSCKPGLCRLIMTLVQKEGDFNAPGLCSSAFYLTGPCTVAVVATGDLNGTPPAQPIVAPPVVHATPGGARLDFSSNKCPVSTGLSNRGDISESCTNLPFNPADMKVLLPPAAQPAFETLLPCTTPPNTPAGCGPAKHSVEIAMQSLTLVVAPVNQYEFDPANACAIPGDTLSSLVVTRCTAAVLRTPVGFTGGTVNYPTSRCKLDLSAEFSGCFAQPFSPSKGTTAIKNLPPLVCRAPIPAIPPAAPAVLPAVACNIFVTLTHDDGDFNAENPCGSLLSGISSACLLASFTTDGRQQGDSITVNAATPVCPAGNGTNAVVDADVHDTCVSADSTIAAPFTAGSLANLLFLGTPSSMTVTIPEDRIV
jgi:hypothetical protein